jgi:hypothetical protein
VRILGAGNPGTLAVPSRSAEGLSADNSHFLHDSGVVVGLKTKTRRNDIALFSGNN